MFPRLYAILDAACFPDAQAMFAASEGFVAAGLRLIQYRNKSGNARVMLEHARELRRRFPGGRGARVSQRHPDPSTSLPAGAGSPVVDHSPRGENPVRLIMNDRADLCLAAEFDGVHVGQEDLSPEAVRKLIGPDRWLGVSTHNPEQVREGDLTSSDYLAIGPVFATSRKERPDPVVGLEGVRRVRSLTHKPLVAIGGITRANAALVIEAGADSVAVISDLVKDPRKSAEEFFRILR